MVGKQHGGVFASGHFELFSVLCARFLNALIEMHSGDFIMKSLSPSTVLVDETGENIRLLMLPVASLSDRANEEVTSAFIDAAKGRSVELSSIPDCGREETRNQHAWDVWGFGMCLYTLAFGETFPTSAHMKRLCPII